MQPVQQLESPPRVQRLTVTIEQLIQSRPALQVLMQEPLPASQAFALVKLAKAVDSELEAFEATRRALCERYSGGVMLPAEGNQPEQYAIPLERRAEWNTEYQDLLKTEVTLGTVGPIPRATLESIRISASTLMALEWLIQ